MEEKEKDVDYKVEQKIVNQNIKTYVTHLREESNWITVTDLLTYNIFQVGFDRGYSKCWKPYVNSKVKDGFIY